MFIHAVYFWFKPGVPKEMREQVIGDGRRFLSEIPGVRQLFVGRPAMTPRVLVDNSYDVGLLVVLDDMAGHDVYQEHPLHKEFVARNKDFWSRVQVYDFQ